MSAWIVNGEPPYDVTEMNVRRFGPIYEDRAYAAERARESYKYYYVLRFPHDENEWARPRRTSPLEPRLRHLGAVKHGLGFMASEAEDAALEPAP